MTAALTLCLHPGSATVYAAEGAAMRWSGSLAPEGTPGSGIPSASLAVSGRQSLVPVCDSAPVTRIMLPCAVAPTAIPIGVYTAVYASIKIRVLIHVNIYTVAAPSESPPGPTPARAQCDAYSESNRTAQYYRAQRVPQVRGICRPPPGTIYHHGVVGRNVNNLGINRFNCNGRSLGHHSLLARALERSLGLCLCPQLLHRIHDLGFLAQERVTQSLRPFKFLIHHSEHRGEVDEGLDAGVPVLTVHRGRKLFSLKVPVCLGPAIRLYNLHGVSGCHEYLDEQRIRVKGYGGEHLIQLGLTVSSWRRTLRGCTWWSLLRGRGRLGENRRGRRHKQNKDPYQCSDEMFCCHSSSSLPMPVGSHNMRGIKL